MSKRQVITQLLGGLGNQMFQYAVARRLAQLHEATVLVDDSILLDHSKGKHVVNRNNDLDVFTLEVKKASPRERMFFNPHGLSLSSKVLFRLHKAIAGVGSYQEPSFRYDDQLLLRPTAPPYLQGLWQSYRYLEGIESLLREDFTFRDPLLEQSFEIAEAIQQPFSVCLNVRRADYVSHADTASTLGFVGLDYYREAAAWMSEQMPQEPRYFVFSDDIDWCRKELTWLGQDTVFVDHGHAGRKFGNYLQLMTLARHYIIPNSTFAWWAAWLSKATEKRVVVPRQWFRDPAMDATDLCPPYWIRL